MTAGRTITPKDEQTTERLMEYWAQRKGAGKII